MLPLSNWYLLLINFVIGAIAVASQMLEEIRLWEDGSNLSSFTPSIIVKSTSSGEFVIIIFLTFPFFRISLDNNIFLYPACQLHNPPRIFPRALCLYFLDEK